MNFLKIHCFLLLFLMLPCSSHGFASQLQEKQTIETTAAPVNDTFPSPSVPVVESPSLLLSTAAPAPEVQLSNLTDGERKWYQRFQEGVPFFDGWKKITEMVIERFPEHEREQRMAAMQALGLKIGYEWSRDNRVRKVNTDMLRAWGKDLRQAGSQNHVQLAQVISKIDGEMNNLLHRQ